MQLLKTSSEKTSPRWRRPEAYQHPSEVSKYTPDQIAERAGSPAWVYARLKLCALAPGGP